MLCRTLRLSLCVLIALSLGGAVPLKGLLNEDMGSFLLTLYPNAV